MAEKVEPETTTEKEKRRRSCYICGNGDAKQCAYFVECGNYICPDHHENGVCLECFAKYRGV